MRNDTLDCTQTLSEERLGAVCVGATALPRIQLDPEVVKAFGARFPILDCPLCVPRLPIPFPPFPLFDSFTV